MKDETRKRSVVELTGPVFLRIAADYLDGLERVAKYVAGQLETLARGPGNFAIADELLRLARVCRGEEKPDGY